MIKLTGMREEPCIMCGRNTKVYELTLKTKSGDNITALSLCRECVKRSAETLKDFSDKMFNRGNTV